jgi:hypothetical protein
MSNFNYNPNDYRYHKYDAYNYNQQQQQQPQQQQQGSGQPAGYGYGQRGQIYGTTVPNAPNAWSSAGTVAQRIPTGPSSWTSATPSVPGGQNVWQPQNAWQRPQPVQPQRVQQQRGLPQRGQPQNAWSPPMTTQTHNYRQHQVSNRGMPQQNRQSFANNPYSYQQNVNPSSFNNNQQRARNPRQAPSRNNNVQQKVPSSGTFSCALPKFVSSTNPDRPLYNVPKWDGTWSKFLPFMLQIRQGLSDSKGDLERFKSDISWRLPSKYSSKFEIEKGATLEEIEQTILDICEVSREMLHCLSFMEMEYIRQRPPKYFAVAVVNLLDIVSLMPDNVALNDRQFIALCNMLASQYKNILIHVARWLAVHPEPTREQYVKFVIHGFPAEGHCRHCARPDHETANCPNKLEHEADSDKFVLERDEEDGMEEDQNEGDFDGENEEDDDEENEVEGSENGNNEERSEVGELQDNRHELMMEDRMENENQEDVVNGITLRGTISEGEEEDTDSILPGEGESQTKQGDSNGGLQEEEEEEEEEEESKIAPQRKKRKRAKA